jgi:hypothetical protein
MPDFMNLNSQLLAPLLAFFTVSLQATPPLRGSSPDTLHVRSIAQAPSADGRVDSVAWGAPQVRIPTHQGTASVWLLRAADTVFVAASIPDSTRSWADALAICFALPGGAGPAPDHLDFQWSLGRTLDSSVVYRGRAGRWAPPLGDPDWRLGRARDGGGWEVSGTDDPGGWTLVLRLDPAWLQGERGRRPAIGFQVHDNDPNGWYSWPASTTSAGVTLLERTPALWVPIE